MTKHSDKTELCRYDYDPLDRQCGCTVVQQPALQRFLCKDRLVTEIQGTARRSIFQHDDQLLAQRNHLGANATTLLLATDQQRSVLNALDAARLHPLAYSPYGHRAAQSGLLSLLGFNGERPDPVTGHYHLGNGYRQFNPVLMRFNSPDSWSPFGKGGLNAYGYCSGNPINRSDPTGHALIPAELFDSVFENLYLLMKNTTFASEQFSAVVQSHVVNFGGLAKLEVLAKSKSITPDDIIISTLARTKRPPSINPVSQADASLPKLYKADKYLRELLEHRNVSQELLNPKNPYHSRLDESTQRNLRLNILDSENEFQRVIPNLLTLRETGRSQSSFNPQDFLELALNIRGT